MNFDVLPLGMFSKSCFNSKKILVIAQLCSRPHNLTDNDPLTPRYAPLQLTLAKTADMLHIFPIFPEIRDEYR